MKRRRRAEPIDHQVNRLMLWEDSRFADEDRPVIEWGELSLSQCRVLVDQLWRGWWPTRAVPRVESLSARSPAHGLAYGDEQISLSPSGRNRMVVAHEVAHAVMWRGWIVGLFTGQQNAEAHGPTFCGVYAKLLAQAFDEPERNIVRSMEIAGLSVFSMGKVVCTAGT